MIDHIKVTATPVSFEVASLGMLYRGPLDPGASLQEASPGNPWQ